MPIKYGELTIVYDKPNSDLLKNIISWFNYEKQMSQNIKYIFSFEDGEICDADDNLINYNFSFSKSTDYLNKYFPLYFNKNIQNSKLHKIIYFLIYPIENNLEYFIDFNKLFGQYQKYNYRMSKDSIYNCIYCSNKDSKKTEAFGIVSVKSNEYMPRYLFAYDNEEFTKEEIIYLINYIFNNLNKQNDFEIDLNKYDVTNF